VSIDKKKPDEREAKKQMVKNEAMSSVYGKSADINTELINKVEKNDSFYDTPRKKKNVTFNSGSVQSTLQPIENNTNNKKVIDVDVQYEGMPALTGKKESVSTILDVESKIKNSKYSTS
jgi:hypothetical protein